MCRKRFEPFKCEFVPKDRLIMFMHKNSELWSHVYNDYKKYLEVLHGYCENPRKYNRYQLQQAERKYRTNHNPFVKTLNALLLLEFNYADSTIAGGGVITRMTRIHDGLRTL